MSDIDDDSWMTDSSRNENRYADILERAGFGPWALLREALKEDSALMLPRMLLRTFGTALKIPKAVLMSRRESREAYARKVVRTWAASLMRLADIRVEVRGADKIDPDGHYLFACNHIATVDPVVAYASLPVAAAFVVNAALADIPVFSYWLRKSGSVLVRQGDPESESHAFKAMIRSLKERKSLLIFPEGYIHQGRGLAEFKRGGLYSAVFNGIPIVPMCVYGTQDVMYAGSLHVTAHQRVRVEFGDPVDTKRLSREERKNIEAVVYNKILDMKNRCASEWSGCA